MRMPREQSLSPVQYSMTAKWCLSKKIPRIRQGLRTSMVQGTVGKDDSLTSPDQNIITCFIRLHHYLPPTSSLLATLNPRLFNPPPIPQSPGQPKRVLRRAHCIGYSPGGSQRWTQLVNRRIRLAPLSRQRNQLPELPLIPRLELPSPVRMPPFDCGQPTTNLVPTERRDPLSRVGATEHCSQAWRLPNDQPRSGRPSGRPTRVYPLPTIPDAIS